MNGIAPWIAGLLRESVTAPRDAARRLIASDPPSEARWIAFALTVVLAAILSHLVRTAFPLTDPPAWDALMNTPVKTAALQAVMTLLMAGIATQVGRMFGGQGEFADALLVVVWLQFVLVVFQAIQLVLLALLPPFSMLIGIAALVIFFWLLTQFVAALHGFTSGGRVFLGIVICFILAALLIGSLLVAVGIPVVQEAP